MAIDTKQRRRAAQSIPLFPVSLLPDGTISAADQQQIGWGYPGIETITATTTVKGTFILPPVHTSSLLPARVPKLLLPKRPTTYSKE